MFKTIGFFVPHSSFHYTTRSSNFSRSMRILVQPKKPMENSNDVSLIPYISVLPFPLPAAPERLRLWETTSPATDNSALAVCPSVQLKELAQHYKLSGANINIIVQYCCYLAKDKGHSKMDNSILLQGIQREFNKESKTGQ